MITPAVGTLPRHATFDASAATAPATRSVTVECVDSASGFSALSPQWNELLRASGANGPFLTWEWLHTWWRHLHGDTTLRLLVVREGHERLAVAPLTLSTRRLGAFSRFDFLGTGDAGSDYLDLIVRTGRETEAIDALAGYLRTQQITVRFEHLAAGSAAGRLAERLSRDGWTATAAAHGVCPIIPLAGHTWDSYLASLGSSHRANVRRRLKQLAAAFDVQFERVTGDADRRAALEALARWHGPRFAARGGSTAFATPALRAFHDEATRRALDRGWLRMYALRLNGAIAAVMYGLLYDRQFYFYQHGFDDRYRQHSTGLVLMALSIRAAIDEGADTFDMLWGTEPYKSLWARDRRLLHRIHLFPPHLGGRLHRRAIEARRHLARVARTVLTAREAPRGT